MVAVTLAWLIELGSVDGVPIACSLTDPGARLVEAILGDAFSGTAKAQIEVIDG